MKKILLLSALLIGLTSCVYPYDSDLSGTSDDILVFEGNIVVGGTSTVKISKVLSFAKDTYYKTGETVGTAHIEDDKGGIYTSESKEAQSYIEIPMENAPSDRKYRMVANVGSGEYFSDWQEVTAPPMIEDISFTLNEDKTRVQVLVTLDGGESATGYIGLSFDETWEFHSDYMCKYVYDPRTTRVTERAGDYPNYWCWRTVSSDVLQLVDYTQMGGERVVSYPLHSFSTGSNRNHKQYSINVKAVTLPKETYKYLKNLGEITDGGGSLFTPNPGEMVSNVSCTDPSVRALGYVTASLETQKRVFLDNRYYSYPSPSTSYLFLPEDKRQSYEDGAYPVDLMFLPRGENGAWVEDIFWGPMYCIDCIAAGGTKEKPDFWK